MITLICCYNNRECLDNMLIPSIKCQEKQPQLILIDNNKRNYKSAAQAYNSEVVNAEGDVLVFCHQDIAFDDQKFFYEIEEMFLENPDMILGLAGVKRDGCVYSNLKYLKNKKYITRKRVKEKRERVESLDECFIAIKTENFRKLLFNEDVCDNWHLYAVELCYRAKKYSIESYVAKIEAYHKMQQGKGLEVDKNFIKVIKRICKMNRGRQKIIYAPCYIVPTKTFQMYTKIIKTEIKIKMKKIFRSAGVGN